MWDWLQIVYSLIGSFFGFGFALLAQKLYDWHNQKEERVKIMDSILDELFGIRNGLKDNLDSPTPLVFDTPIWNAIVNSGRILSLIKFDKSKYESFIRIYNHFAILERLEENSIRQQDVIKKEREAIIDLITTLEDK